MFSLHDFAMSALTGMIGNYPDWQVREYALGWHDRKHLTEDDLAAIETAIAAYREAQQHPPEPPLMPESPTEPEPTPNQDEPQEPAAPDDPAAPAEPEIPTDSDAEQKPPTEAVPAPSTDEPPTEETPSTNKLEEEQS